MGCALLREGVYLLPDNPVNRQGLQRLSEHTIRIHGSAHVLHVASAGAEQERSFKSMFDRAGKYEELIKAIEGLHAGFGISEPSAIARVLNKQRREFEAISALDFFDSPLKERAARALRETEAEVRKRMFPDAAKSGGRLTQTGRYYFKRVWASRKPLLADRLASLAGSGAHRRGSHPDVAGEDPGALHRRRVRLRRRDFSNSRDRVTFEELLARSA
jgi:hypothetical protein